MEEKAKSFEIFGIRAVMEAINTEKEIDKVMIKRGSDNPLHVEIEELCKKNKITVQFVPQEKIARMTKVNHQGVVALLSPIEYGDIMEVYDKVTDEGRVPLIVVLDSVTDVRNFGAIARSAECAGADALVVSLKNSAPVNADAIKTSAGALTVIPVCRVGSIRNCLKFLQTSGVQVVAASEKASELLFEADFTLPTAIVMGSEDKGISKEVMKMCDKKVAIPLRGKIESLNVSAAATVMLFEVVRQRFQNM
ncbi:MAG: 23S rRNA (guanosine(2251)-2'-O)-methyltransferase RlmB [Rikenellaceae bacterium]